MADPGLAALVAHVGAFHVTDRALKRAQAAIEAQLRADTVDDRARAAYLDAVQRYFEGFHAEARAQLHDVDRRLEHANQVAFNLTAERGVAVKRIEATQGILRDLAALAQAAP